LHTEFVDVFLFYFHNKFNLPNSDNSLFITTTFSSTKIQVANGDTAFIENCKQVSRLIQNFKRENTNSNTDIYKMHGTLLDRFLLLRKESRLKTCSFLYASFSKMHYIYIYIYMVTTQSLYFAFTLKTVTNEKLNQVHGQRSISLRPFLIL
jgi:hypothetical protein